MDTQPVKHKIIIVLIKQTVIEQEKLPYAPHFLATSEVPYLKDIRSLIWKALFFFQLEALNASKVSSSPKILWSVIS